MTNKFCKCIIPIWRLYWK